MYNTLKKLINKRYYADRQTAMKKVETVYAMSLITDEQFMDLVMLIDEKYPDVETLAESEDE